MRILATAGVLVLLCGTAWAQQPAPGARAGGAGRGTPPPTTDLTKGTAMTDAALHAAIAAQGSDRPMTSTRVFTLPGDRPYAVAVEHRMPMPQNASVHETEAELFYLIDGSATMVTGGKLVGETRNGVNLSGTGIEGGTPTKLKSSPSVSVSPMRSVP